MQLYRNRYYSDNGIDYVFSRLNEELAVRGIKLDISPTPTLFYDNTDRADTHASKDDGEISKVDGEVNKDDGEIVEGEVNKVEGEISKVEGEASKDDGEISKVEGEASKDDGEIGEGRGSYAIFWDKDIRVARMLERQGKTLLPNSAFTLAACDDKELTYSLLASSRIPLIKTISAPLVFDVNQPLDKEFLNEVENKLKYPIIIKENMGSQGKQVYLASRREELEQYNQRLLHLPHIYQEFRGEYGSDIRVYIIGGRAVACVKRKNTTTFKSNVALGGDVTTYPLDDSLRKLAEQASKILKLEYGTIDFLVENDELADTEGRAAAGELADGEGRAAAYELADGEGRAAGDELADTEGRVSGEKARKQYYFLEANSNAYFRGIESLGISIADKLAEHIMSRISFGNEVREKSNGKQGNEREYSEN